MASTIGIRNGDESSIAAISVSSENGESQAVGDGAQIHEIKLRTSQTQLNPKAGKSGGVKDVSAPAAGGGVQFPSVFSAPGVDAYDAIEWELRDAVISDEKGKIVFEQKGVEVPKSWSQMATNVVVSKYFRGPLAADSSGKGARESSVRQLVSRVADTIASWGAKDRYFVTAEQTEIFRQELKALLVNQYAAFNSPVWFNVGVEPQPQCSACFILSVDDTMESLLDLQKAEGMLFKYGSGAGSNLSRIRSSKELLSGGGAPSGPVSFMRGYDAWAGTIKSGGKTRRAAKMQILDVDHPDIVEFINAKQVEEKKAWALIEQGYNGGFNVPGGAYDSAFFQNSNLSVRVTDEFMEAVEAGKKFATRSRTDGNPVELLDARTILRNISEGTWICGDPGVQFDTMINRWHTCPNSGRINGSNPCSEYMHLDDSACNLASINLLKFLSESGEFEIDRFKHAVDILITAQDILVDNASYPTFKIGENARAYRQLGLGFANLGAVLMSLGLAYDSDQGRAVSGSIMALLCGEAYLQSARLAATLEPFSGFAANREDMLKVIAMHRDSVESIPRIFSTETLIDSARTAWNDAYALGSIAGVRNSQATVLAPTGTIAFLMDCDTTGIEPDIALVKYKKLIGGGMLKIVNNTVPQALSRLGYTPAEVVGIVGYIDAHDTIEGAPGLKEEHLDVFDCAFRPRNGVRSIHYLGHIKMMAAAQPFVSGAISKTVNLPEHSTAEDIYSTYLEAWKLGLKAIAIYRDNSKRSQPLATGKDKQKDQTAGQNTAAAESNIVRRHLPDERHAITHKFNIAGHEGYITVGLYDDGAPGEIFIVMAKEGSILSGVMDAFATSISLALQYGVPLGALIQKFSHMRFEPSGFTNNPKIPFAKSVMDYIFRWLGSKFLPRDEQIALGIHLEAEGSSEAASSGSARPEVSGKHSMNGSVTAESLKSSAGGDLRSSILLSDDAPPCTNCGSSLMVRQASCYRCLNCGSQGGCG